MPASPIVLETASYADRVAQSLAWFLHSGTHGAMEVLAPLIGDHNLGVGPHTHGAERIAGAAWVTLLRSYDRNIKAAAYAEQCILTGLLCNDRWKTLFQSEADAYAFIVMLVRHLCRAEMRVILQPVELRALQTLKTKVLEALAPWLPSCTEPGTFKLRDLTCAFFGEAWCSLVYDSSRDTFRLAKVIATTKPMFLPGRIASGQGQDVHPLPELTC
jgi:hypothetical protein